MADDFQVGGTHYRDMAIQPIDDVKTRQVGGDHYRVSSGLQPWDVIEAFELDFWEASALKYLLRYRRKNGREDLEKCLHYLQYLIARWCRDHPGEEVRQVS